MGYEQTGECSRRVLLRGAAVGGVALPLLTACGSDEPAAPPATGEALAKTADVPVGGGAVLQDQKIVVTQPAEGDFKAFTAVCTHQGCVVANVSKGTINCECHGSMFDAQTGEVTGGPAQSPLEEIKVEVDGDQIVTA
ncbi:MAG: Rieske (2Fe-2S) domain protein [uncultured Nocardioidaceae bacterium]|uniref:Cytochrome bc1 complex Rieske iron-sulfur subunit n=1 Tax=uncultured Nocardioidaceae bacterium TaxID=253824 RepID=A0A6J4LDS9_9ACTN|nr:MAG: Rieske (2Fe-2S) domain protein [uncultured Nocardioidaceae bacterium]